METKELKKKDEKVSKNGIEDAVEVNDNILFNETDIENIEKVFRLARKGNGTDDEGNLYKLIVSKQQLIAKIQNAINNK